MTLDTPIERITSIGRKVAPSLKKLGLNVVRDLIFYWPFRYEDWSKVKAIKDVGPNEQVTIKGTLEMIQNKRSKWKKRLLTEAIIADSSGKIRTVWFHQTYLTRNLKPGNELYISGKVELSDSGLQFTHPNYEKISKSKITPTHTARIVPMYALTKKVSQKQLRYLISQTIRLSINLNEWLPLEFIKQYKLPKLSLALKGIHFPANLAQLRQAQHRFKFEELFLINLRAQINKLSLKQTQAQVSTFQESETKKFVANLPFQLTQAQKKAGWEILRDIQKNKPMNRLLEGDVGSGKTVTAALAILNTLLNKQQVAYMAPTEILASQQYVAFVKLFQAYNFKIALLTGSRLEINFDNPAGLTKNKLKKFIKEGTIDFTIGTHALFQESVDFSKPGLVIVDEQHRFGVRQRAELLARGQQRTGARESVVQPHFLSMTATPIPRSLALTLYGDLDLSIIDELPTGRLPIETKIIPPDKRGENYKFIKDEIAAGRQAFVICPLIDPSDKLGKKAVTEEYEKLKNQVFPELKIGLLHGRLKASEKEWVMHEFAAGELNILVATPVVEVGIDVPNATVMLIESAERFGLAQLHQFRGRVGRSHHQSYCLLFTESIARDSLQRLQALVDSQDGFALAERDLEFRGPGEVYGVKQHGFDDLLKIAKLTDYQVIKEAQAASTWLLKVSPDLKKYPSIKQWLDEFETKIHLE